MRVLAVACALLALSSLAARADSASSPASAGTGSSQPAATANQVLPPAPVVPYSWAGFYVRSSDADLARPNSATNTPDMFSATSASAMGLASGLSSSQTTGEVGANWQNGHTVVGFESDMRWSGQGASPLSGCGLGCSLNDRVRVPWFASFRARAGEAFDRLYVYGTGGFSTVGVADTLNPYGSSAVPNFTDLSASTLKWTMGLGMEYAVDNDVTAKLEFLYKSPITGSTDTILDNTNASMKSNVIRGGLDYRIPIGQ